MHFNQEDHNWVFTLETRHEFARVGEHVREMYTTLNPTFIYSKTGACWGIPIFLIFDPKHRFWVLVRTASPRRFPTIYVMNKNIKNIRIFTDENFQFLQLKKFCTLHGPVFVMLL